MTDQQLVLSPLVRLTRLSKQGSTVVHAGQGESRGHFELSGPGAFALVRWLLDAHGRASQGNWSASLHASCGMSTSEANDLILQFTKMEVLVPADVAGKHEQILKEWSAFGWREAADFHLATFGLPFDPDELNGLTYADYYKTMLRNADNDAAGHQPEASFRRGEASPLRMSGDGARSGNRVEDVLQQAEPVNRFGGEHADLEEFLPPLQAAFGVQSIVSGDLGDHQLRSYPSGGARHPFEVYVVSKGVSGMPQGIYHFDVATGGLEIVPDHGDPFIIDKACFGKRGIKSAGVILVFTCRWLRHSWKYRYARSYRMLHLEVGHIVQAVNLSMIDAGLQCFFCPSINDRLLRAMLAITDDTDEGPVYVLGVGKNGVR